MVKLTVAPKPSSFEPPSVMNQDLLGAGFDVLQVDTVEIDPPRP